MCTAPQATLIVTLRTTDDFEVTRRRIMKIKGVRSVDLNYISCKLRVRYDGDAEKNLEIRAAVQETIAPLVSIH